ncbi:MAG TPA: nuclear transport factor 2 family protein [Anaerolineales bacterium]|nr:nuclear transport factor 2 family protein [Anaerolineales bacterium]
MAIKGKGVYIWKIRNCEGGDVTAIAKKAKNAGLTHVLVKIADGDAPFNVPSGRDLALDLTRALRDEGIQTWGWHYVRGDEPTAEGNAAVDRVRQLRLDGYVVDAEIEYRNVQKRQAARDFMSTVRSGLPNTPIAFCSYRYPSLHQAVPWAEFLEKCDYNMPQVYWEQSHNSDQQLARSVSEFNSSSLVGYVRPVLPVGAAYGTRGWRAEPTDVQKFFQKAKEMNLAAASVYSWDWATSPGNSDLWDAVANFSWAVSTPPETRPTEPTIPNLPVPANIEELLKRYLKALNEKNVDLLLSLYHENAGLVAGQKLIIGRQALRTWFEHFLFNLLPNGAYNVGLPRGADVAWSFRWTCNSTAGQVQKGNDTLGLRDGLIQYHFMSFIVV